MYIDILFLKLLVPCSSKGLQNIFGLGIWSKWHASLNLVLVYRSPDLRRHESFEAMWAMGMVA